MSRKLAVTLNMDKEEWLRLRKKGIGGSDAGAVCGLNPYRTAIQVYQDKISDEIEDIDNEAMRLGRDLEDYVAHRFMQETGLKVRRSNVMYQHEEHPFMFADVDRLIVGMDCGLECKTASAYHADKWKDGKIPVHYLLQCYHYMAVTGKRSWYIAVVILGVGFQYEKVTWDDEIIHNLIRIEKDFWENNVLAGKMPDPDGSKVADEVIAGYFKKSNAQSILLQGFDERLMRRQELVEVIERMETEKRQIEQELKLYMGEAEVAENARYRVFWKSVETSKVDTKRLKEEQPEIYQQYSRPSEYRRFTVKAA